jgi:hypothetical protein
MLLVVPGRSAETVSTFLLAICWLAKRVTSENKLNSAGAVLRIALSAQCLWVSKPRCWRTSWKVASICHHRLTNHEMIRSGSVSRSVHSKAWVSNPS